jgi:putative ABC transport system substrate-binding protein
MPVIGFLSSRSPSNSTRVLAAFREGLRVSGYVEGQNVAIEYRWAEDRYDQLAGMAADLVRREVAVIAAVGGFVSALPAKAATSTIPIVFIGGGDPVKLGLVASLNRPGGNITGVSNITIELLPKRLDLLRQIIPNVIVVGLLVNPTNATTELQLREMQQAARILGWNVLAVQATKVDDFDQAFAKLVHERAGAVVLSSDPFLNTHTEKFAAAALQHRMPAIADFRDFAIAGGLMSYGTDVADGYRQVGNYTGRILKGERPADLPVMQSAKFELVINLKTAKALGLEVPASLLARADEVIE